MGGKSEGWPARSKKKRRKKKVFLDDSVLGGFKGLVDCDVSCATNHGRWLSLLFSLLSR